MISLLFASSLAAGAVALTAHPERRDLFGAAQCLFREPIFSCENKTVIQDACCSPTPGGLVLQTQFWDTYTGLESQGQLLPKNSWTIHGLWPDNCDGSYESYCDFSRQYDPDPSPKTVNGQTVPPYTGPGVDTFLEAFGREDLLAFMNRYWIAQGQPNEQLWAHEFSKHATCFSCFDPSCYHPYKQHEDVVDFYSSVIRAYQEYPTYSFLQRAGIVPSNTTTYALADLQAALKKATGATPYLGCYKGALDEVWYYSHSFGPPQLGIFKHLDSTTPSSCPATGIRYLQRSPGSEH